MNIIPVARISTTLALILTTSQAIAAVTILKVDSYSNAQQSTLYDINASGQVVGDYFFGNNIANRHGFVLANGERTDIGVLDGRTSYAYGINSSGTITGQSTNSSGTATSAYIYSNGTMQAIPSLGGSAALGRAINDAGQVAGSGTNSSGRYNAFIYSNGELTNLGTLGGDTRRDTTYAYDINNQGQIVGQSVDSDGRSYAYIWENGTISSLGALPGGTDRSGNSVSEARAINDAGQIAGRSLHADNSSYHAFFYENGTMTDIGTLGGNGSTSHGINNAGWVVGISDTMTAGVSHAFLYSQETGILNLNDYLPEDSGWELTLARTISDNGIVIGYGRYTDPVSGVTAGLTPFILSGLDFTAVPAVPEPESYALMLAGLGLIGVAARRRKYS